MGSHLRECPSEDRHRLDCSNVFGGLVEIDDPIHQDAPASLRAPVLGSFTGEESAHLVLVLGFLGFKENTWPKKKLKMKIE